MAVILGVSVSPLVSQSLSIDDITQAEGNSGTTAFVFTVSLSPPSQDPVDVDFATSDSSAKVSDNDYLAASGAVHFDPNETIQTLTVDVTGDTKLEGTESFVVSLSNPVNATITDAFGLGSIINDDVGISIDNVTMAEGNSGTTNFVFTVSLSAPYTLPVDVDFATSDSSAKVSDNDYLAASGIVHFDPNETIQTLTVDVTGDTKLEGTESFVVSLSNPVNATITDAFGLGSIINDDVGISIDNVTMAEGNSGTTNFVFTVSLSAPYTLPVDVDFTTSDNSAKVSDNDYLAASGIVHFDPNETARTLTVQVAGDTKLEGSENFSVILSNPVNATITDAFGLGSIVNDDVGISIDNVTMAEGNSGTTDFIFTVSLSAPYTLPVDVDFTTSDNSAKVADNDYLAASGIVHFDPNETARTLTVQVAGDTKLEASENFNVILSNPVNATITDAFGLGSIIDDDVGISIGDVTQAEGDSGTTGFDFTVSLTGPYPLAVDVDYATSDNSATVADNDYLAASGTVHFDPNETARALTVQVIGDTKLESSENFNVILSNPVNATILDGLASGFISNDDVVPVVSVGDVTMTEGDSGATSFIFDVTLSAAADATVTVDVATQDGTAAAPGDYSGFMQTVTFQVGSTSEPVQVDVQGESIFELDETFHVLLSNPSNAFLGDSSGEGTILNDDPLEASIDDVLVTEGDMGTAAAGFTVSLSNPSEVSSSVTYQTAQGSATSGIDYAPAGGTLDFLPGQSSLPVDVTIVGEPDFEIDETFTVELAGSVTASILDGSGLGTILNDDASCAPAPEPVEDLLATPASGGMELLFTWTDRAGVTLYTLYENDASTEPFGSQAGAAASGTAGITIPVPPGDAFYLLTSSNAGCGEGPRRLCAHDTCEAGPRLDSGCDLCAADICTGNPACCTTGWDVSCVEKVRTVCGSLRCPDSQGACAHGLCVEGGPLTAGCDDPPVSPSCVDAICLQDPACCSVAWSASCVAAVDTVCGLGCD